MRTLKILGLLLTYPTPSVLESLLQCRKLLQEEALLDEKDLLKLYTLIDWMLSIPELDLQEQYVDLFDRTPSLSLHLFEHVHGDSRERGQALVELTELYQEKKLEIKGDEIADYLPMFLEYLSVLSLAEAKDNLANIANILTFIARRLENRNSYYSSVFYTLATLSGQEINEKIVDTALKVATGEKETLEKTDEKWQETSAFDDTANNNHKYNDKTNNKKYNFHNYKEERREE